MSQLFQMNMPKYPECWETCGNCAQGEVFVLEMLVAPGDHVAEDDNVLTLETGKVALDIPSPRAGTVQEVFLGAGDKPGEGAPILTLVLD